MNKKKIEETLSDVGKKLGKVAWLVGKSSASSWACWHFTHFVTFECWRLGGNPCRTFTSWLPNAGEKKNLLPINWGQIIRIQGSPKRAKRTGLNLQIHQKHSPGNWTVVIERQTGQTLHTATGNKCARTHWHTFTLQVSHAGKSTSVVFGRLHSTHGSLRLPVTTGLKYHRHLN